MVVEFRKDSVFLRDNDSMGGVFIVKKLLLSLLLTFCSVALIACQSQNEEMTLLESVSDISISKSNGYGGLNESFFLTINQEETISGFEEVLINAKGKKQKVDTVKDNPDYDILVLYENGETLDYISYLEMLEKKAQ